MCSSIGSFLRKTNTNGSYSALPPEAITANSLGVIIVAFALVVLKILSNQIWQRPEPGYDEGIYRVRDKGFYDGFVNIVTKVILIFLP